jgi:hypothetical protein
LKPPFIFATSGQKKTSQMDATGNSETFEYELGYAWLDILGFGGTSLFNYSYGKKNPYLDSP